MRPLAFIPGLYLMLTFSVGPAHAAEGASFLDLDLKQSRYLSDASETSPDRNYTVYGGNLNLETQSSAFNFKINPIFEGTIEQSDEFYAGIPEAFVQPRKVAPGFNLTIGRQKRQWSRLDEEFNLGIWQPQLRWDYLAPTQEGLTGVYFDWSLSTTLKVTFFTSPLFVPDQGPNYHLDNGQFSSNNRWFSAPQSRVELFNKGAAPLFFDLQKPSEQDIFMHSSFGFSVNYQATGPWWTEFSYAYKPLNQIHLGIECANCGKIGSPGGPPLEITAVIHPRVVNHNVVTWEGGFTRVDDKGWLSLTGDLPLRSGFPADYAESPLNAMVVFGGAYQHYMGAWIGAPSWLQYSYMRTLEFKHDSDNGLVPDDDVRSSYDRYPYHEILAVDWQLLLLQGKRHRLHWKNRYSYSVPERGGWLSTTFEWAQGPLTYTLGADVLGAAVDPNSPEAGLFSRYRANDRVYGGVGYVF